MDATETLRHALIFSHQWVKQLADDLTDAPFEVATPVGGNHPLWLMGHLAFSNAGLTSMISGRENPLQSWESLFGGGTTPEHDAQAYPGYADVLREWEKVHHGTLQVLDEVGDSRLDEAPRAVWEPLRNDPDFSSNGRLFLFLAMHEMSHRGQLADVRRKLGRKPFA